MQTLSIPGTPLRASRIAFGCMHLSRAWDQEPLTEAERRQTRALVETALAQGITLFDHADIYARGKSERLFGEVLGQSPSLRDQMVLQSKCGIRFAHEPQASSPGLGGAFFLFCASLSVGMIRPTPRKRKAKE